MKSLQNADKNDEILKILKRLTIRIEDATVDIHSLKSDVKMMNLRLGSVEKSTKLMQIDIENIKEKIIIMGKKVNEIVKTQSEIVENMVTQKEFSHHNSRISSLEQTLKAS